MKKFRFASRLLALTVCLALVFSVISLADTYTVQKGDNLTKIAAKYDTTWQSLSKLNGLKDPNYLNVGQQLVVPSGGKAPDAPQVQDVTEGDYPAATDFRIVTLAPSQTEILYFLGLQDGIVGWTQYEDYPVAVTEVRGWVPYEEYQFVSVEDELAKEKAVVGSFTMFNYDVIAALEPTHILAIDPIQQKIVDELREMGYTVLHYNPETVEDVFEMWLDIADTFGRAPVAEKIVAEQRKEIEEIRAITENLPKVSVYMEIGHRIDYGEYGVFGPYATGAGSPMDDIIAIAGGVNVFGDVEKLSFQVEYDQIVEKNPDVILSPMWPRAGDYEVTSYREIVNREGFEDITAVKTSRIYFYDSSLLKRPSPRQITAIKKMAYLLHPYYFQNPPNSVSPWELGRIDVKYFPDRPLD